MRKFFLVLALTSSFGFLQGQEKQISFPGRAASLVLDRDGRLVIVHQDPGRGLGLASVDPQGGSARHLRFVSSPSALSPVIKKNGAGDIWAAWEEHEAGTSEIRFGRLQEDGVPDSLPVVRSSSPLFSPSLDFGDTSEPWLAWIREDGQKSFVCAASLGLKKTWIVNGPFTTAALNPKVLVGGNGEVWVFWTGRDKGRDEIFGAVFRGEAWSAPFRLNNDDRYPHTSQSAALDAAGYPRVVWSAYDGRQYEIFTSAWDGRRWSPEARISESGVSNASPAISFVFGSIPLIVWGRASEEGQTLCARYKDGPNWSPELKIIPDQPGQIRSPRIAVLGNRIGLTWESGERIGSLRTGFIDLAGRTSPRAPVTITAANENAARLENQYTCFGDSITFAENQGYQPRLQPLLAQKYGSATLWNEGEGGEVTQEGLARIDLIIAAHPSKYLLLMEGTNDVIFLEFSMDTTAFNLREMVRKSVTAGMVPLLATIIPRKDWRWTTPPYQSRIVDLNGKIRQYTTVQKVALVDQFEAFISYSDSLGGWRGLLFDDGVHPNPSGFQVMAETWFAGIKRLRFVQPPLSPALETKLDGAGVTKINAISWQANPANADIPVQRYRVYRKSAAQPDSSFSFLASVPGTALRYEDTNLNVIAKYAYRVTAYSESNDESDPTASVTEIKKFEFPPLHLAVLTTNTRILFFIEKSNTIAFETNPLNDPTEVSGYKVYRRKAEGSDTDFAPLVTLDTSTLSYRDSRLPPKQKYAYAVTTLFTDGRESQRSNVATSR